MVDAARARQKKSQQSSGTRIAAGQGDHGFVTKWSQSRGQKLGANQRKWNSEGWIGHKDLHHKLEKEKPGGSGVQFARDQVQQMQMETPGCGVHDQSSRDMEDDLVHKRDGEEFFDIGSAIAEEETSNN